ncbi:unnamed protein product [Bursaphelenchus xylophilus]|uniref:(pine wood nematode) hypothetical protein n=1 Tax=Bursaphelenchus xylophilus TaxID=6326 RepID=A0A1I7SLD9_BURXY|nr:unnamed protein product [Bursaphelenchus xylophilus]CAG9129522.1 unnamed protein product [Bursaphelenchus xylophilus]
MSFNSLFFVTVLFFIYIDFTLADPSECRPEDVPTNDIKRRIVYLDRNNGKFFAVISLGVPLQDFNVALDFNSAVLWVPHSNCRCADECKQAQFCKENCSQHCCEQNLRNKRMNEVSPLTGKCTNKMAFRVKKSRLYMETRNYLRVKYAGEDLLTFISLDQMSFGSRHAPGITIPHVEFGLLREFPESYEDAVNDGVLGLAISDKNGNQSIMKQLLDRNFIPNPIITIWINNGKGDLQLVDGSMTIGEIDTRVCENKPGFFKLASLDKWAFLLNGASVSGKEFPRSKISIDLEAPKLVVPHEVLVHIIELCNAQMDESTGDLIGECTDTAVVISQGGISMQTNLINYMTKYDNIYCLINVREATPEDPSEWVLNAGVTKDFCIILDYSGHLGFTPIKAKKS